MRRPTVGWQFPLCPTCCPGLPLRRAGRRAARGVFAWDLRDAPPLPRFVSRGLVPPDSCEAHPNRPSVLPLLLAGVRKHARKTHMAWLKAIDENAGSRDRQLESKPSTYCHMEVVDESEVANEPDESPAMTAAVPTVPIAKIPLFAAHQSQKEIAYRQAPALFGCQE